MISSPSSRGHITPSFAHRLVGMVETGEGIVPRYHGLARKAGA